MMRPEVHSPGVGCRIRHFWVRQRSVNLSEADAGCEDVFQGLVTCSLCRLSRSLSPRLPKASFSTSIGGNHEVVRLMMAAGCFWRTALDQDGNTLKGLKTCSGVLLS
jgi:hypothetical protein